MSTAVPGFTPPALETLDRLAAVVGDRYALRDADAKAPYLVERRDKYFGAAAMVLRPADVTQVSQILRIANETRTAIVPQAGNTGLVGGQIPFESGHEVVVSVSRLDAVRDLDALDNTLVAEAGCILANVQQAADDADRLFPLSLAAQGTCEIGGNVATNAGGTGVLAYGSTRDLVLGLEVVLADGRVWNGLRRLRKDNTGYDLKNLFVGSEGTLGIITAAALKLYPKPTDVATAFAGAAAPARALDLLALAQDRSGRRVTSFEFMPRTGLEFVLRHAPASRDPLSNPHPWYVLVELSGGGAEGALRGTLEAILGEAHERGLIEDAAIAASQAQARDFWRLREDLSDVQRREGGSIKHDVSVPVSKVPAFLDAAMPAVEALVPGCRLVPFGHLGDGNVHFNVSQPVGADAAAFLARWDEVAALVHGIVAGLGGSISAEHGIGRMKRDAMPSIKDPVELDLMYAIKRQLDPNGIMNPGKVLPVRG
jgi:FAD/FMN-containing dehydrogenase